MTNPSDSLEPIPSEERPASVIFIDPEGGLRVSGQVFDASIPFQCVAAEYLPLLKLRYGESWIVYANDTGAMIAAKGHGRRIIFDTELLAVVGGGGKTMRLQYNDPDLMERVFHYLDDVDRIPARELES
jgi:hypothetical protein